VTRKSIALFGLIMTTWLLTTGVAIGAAAAPAPEMDVQVWAAAQPGQALVIVGATLATDTPLPATVQLPVVQGTSVDWAGEIGDSSGQDAQRDFALRQGAGGQYVEFEVSQSRNAQIELSGIPLTTADGSYSATVNWVQTVPASVTTFSVRLPAGASAVTLDPTPAREPETNQAGETLYTLPSRELAEGAGQVLYLSYETPASGSSSAAAEGDSSPVLAILIVLLVVMTSVLALVLVKRRNAKP